MPTAELRRAARLILLAAALIGALAGTIHALLTDPLEIQP